MSTVPRASARLRHGLHDRFARVPDEKFADVGLERCSEIVAEIATVEGTASVHLTVFSWEEAIPEVLARAGIAPRGQRRIRGARP